MSLHLFKTCAFKTSWIFTYQLQVFIAISLDFFVLFYLKYFWNAIYNVTTQPLKRFNHFLLKIFKVSWFTYLVVDCGERVYTPCCCRCHTELGPCDMYTCAGPGEICVELKTGPHCQCPSCEDETRRPVCGALLNKVDTYDTECQLRVQACLTRHNYYILDNVSCEGRGQTVSYKPPLLDFFVVYASTLISK